MLFLPHNDNDLILRSNWSVSDGSTIDVMAWEHDYHFHSNIDKDQLPSCCVIDGEDEEDYEARDTTVTVRRRVCFDDTRNIVHESDKNVFLEDCQELWYNSTDYSRFRAESARIAKEIVRNDSSQLLAVNKDTDSSHVDHFPTVIEGIAEAFRLNEGDENEDAELVDFCFRTYMEHVEQWDAAKTMSSSLLSAQKQQETRQQLLNRLGLERATCHQLRLDRRDRRKEIAEVVLSVQDEYESYYYVDPLDDTRSQDIANAAQRVSRPSRLFAVFLALAQRESYTEGNSK